MLLKEKDISIWTKKLDWIAEKGGMVLVNVHPDYVCFEGEPGMEEFTVERYLNLLKYVKDKYAGQFLNILPKELAEKMNNMLRSNKMEVEN